MPSGHDLSSARNSTGQGKRKLKKTAAESGKSGVAAFYKRNRLAIFTASQGYSQNHAAQNH
jgi:hypothetical protein